MISPSSEMTDLSRLAPPILIEWLALINQQHQLIPLCQVSDSRREKVSYLFGFEYERWMGQHLQNRLGACSFPAFQKRCQSPY